jgi:two-component system cell cycle response regulator
VSGVSREAPERVPIGSTPSLRGRLALQRPRPVLVRLYASLLGEAGLAGPWARRRALALAARSLPAAVTVAAGALVALRAFEARGTAWPQAAGMAALAAALAGVGWRRVARAAAGVRAAYREQLEIGSLAVVAAYATAQAAAAGEAESPFQALVYLVMAFLVAFLSRGVGFALVLLAVALEGVLWAGRGARAWDLPAALVHAGFVALFAVLYHAALAAQIAAGRRAEADAVARRLREIASRAEELRLLAPGGGEASDPADRDRRWTEAAVVEVEAAVRGALEVAGLALRSHTCAVFMLSADDRELRLRECRSASEAVARGPLAAGEGALGAAVHGRGPVRLHGDVRPPGYYADGTRPRALLAVPLVDRRGGHVRGVVVADRLEPLPFGDEEERLLVALSSEILRAADAERLMIDMRRARDEKERFYDAIERLNRQTKPLEVFDATLDAARGMVAVDFAAVTLVEEGGGGKPRHRIARVLGAERATERLEGLEFGDDAGLVASAVRLGASLPGKELDIARTPVFDRATRLRGLGSLKVIPLRTAQQVLGTVVLGAARPGAYGRDAVRQLEVVAMQAADSIYRARLFEQTERLATTDGLTGLTNHRTFQGRLDEHLAQAQRYGKKLSLILCDIDHFKSVNDLHGHPAGDLVLKGVARTLAKEARATDVVARYGGEEFAVVMPETDAEGALVIAERIRDRVGKLVFETDRGRLRITLSLGIATFPEDAGRKADLVERADGCLYHAKRSGRNRTVAAASLRGQARAAS